MKKFKIGNLWVQFPYVPYGPQEEFMKKMVMSLEAGENALLESPTGTGKTLCLLCASLAWLDSQKKLEEIPELRPDDSDDENVAESTYLHQNSRIKVYFCSRTHSQIKQAVNEFKACAYGHLRSSVMGSRKHLCINPVAKNAGTNLEAKCRSLRCQTKCSAPGPDIEDLPKKCSSCLGDHKCPYYENFEVMKSKGEDIIFTEGGALDQMDLIIKCKKYKVCPFYMSRHMQKNADIVFLPYSYIFNPHILRGLRLNIENSVIIIDEGHNLEAVCEENASFSVKVSDFLNALDELNNVLRLVGSEKLPAFIQEKDARKLALISEKLANSFDTAIKPGDNNYSGADCIKYFIEAGLTHNNQPRILYNLKEIIQAMGENQMKTEGMKKLQEVCSCVFYLDNEQTDTHLSALKESFVLYKEKVPKELGSQEKKKFEPNIFFWCFDAGVIMRSLYRREVRSFIVTSGTLSPLDPLMKSLSIPFKIRLINDHVIDKSQVLGLCVPQCKTVSGQSEDLNFTFKNREQRRDFLYEALGNMVFRVASVSPKGLLIFFPSTKVKITCLERWEKVKVLDHNNEEVSLFEAINNLKPIYEEPSLAGELPGLQRKYNEKINEEGTDGACLIGVMSGKVSEGIDFKDDLGRVVIMVGLPYPPYEDPWVKQKRKFLQKKSSGDSNRDETWYLGSAIRPVNQALGRIIRHQRDYGVVILADIRYKTHPPVINALPQWLKTGISHGTAPERNQSLEYVSFDDLQERLKKFFTRILLKIQEVNLLSEKKELEILERHSEEKKKEEVTETNYNVLIKKRDEERKRERNLISEISELQREMKVVVHRTDELRNKLSTREEREASQGQGNPCVYDSDCNSTEDTEWEAVEASM